LSPDNKAILKKKLLENLKVLEGDIVSYRELTKPIAPENAIGRISRMDAINNKSVNEAALRNSLNKKTRLNQALKQIDTTSFGLCRQCGLEIEMEKLLVVPESIRCISCVKGDR
jgi:RNA polymerase-binding transcription factor